MLSVGINFSFKKIVIIKSGIFRLNSSGSSIVLNDVDIVVDNLFVIFVII